MATTTNYSWSTPDDTALVKDGAAAIRSLGTAIDSTVFTNAGAAIAKTIVDAKGDLIVATAADTVARLASSASNGDVLTVDTSTASGLKWNAPAAAMTLLSTTTLSGSSTTITVAGGYNDLQIVISGMTYDTGDEVVQIRVNASTTLAYGLFNRNAGGSPLANAISDATINTINDPKRTGGNNAFALEIKNYANTSYHKPYRFFGGTDTGSGWLGFHSGGVIKTNSAVTSFVIQTASGYNLTGGQVLTYGVK
jgi:hypothetical protein